MARIAKALMAIEVGRIKEPGYHSVGTVPGLTLQVTGNGARSWILRVKVGSKRREIGLGPYPEITLAAAHEKARAARESINQGNDPVLEKKSLKSALLAKQAAYITFEDAAVACYNTRAVKWRNAKHGAQWLATLKTYAYPVIGKLAVSDIGDEHIHKILEPIWQTKNETASRVRGRLETVLNWATVKKYRKGENPARWRGHLDVTLSTPAAKEVHYPAVQIADAGAFMRDLKQRQGNGARCLEFAMLCASRSGEARGAVWSEFDLTNKVWTIPANRMKGKIEHRVPLSESAIGILNALTHFEGVPWVFASPTGKQLSDMTLSALMRRLDYKATDGRVCVPHGLRSTFRDWTAERTSFDRQTIEAALAHKNADKVEAAYLRSDVLDKRRQLMDKWAKFLSVVEQKSATVTPIRKVAA
jgi:integrase